MGDRRISGTRFIYLTLFTVSVLLVVVPLLLLKAAAQEYRNQSDTWPAEAEPATIDLIALPSPIIIREQSQSITAVISTSTPQAFPTAIVTKTTTPSPVIQARTPGIIPTLSPDQTPAIPSFSAKGTKLIALDPGHGGNEVGSASTGNGPRLVEKELNLIVAKQTAAILEAKGYRVLLTRTSDSSVNKGAEDLNGDGKTGVDDDLQARVDLANDADADLLVSIHHNGSGDPQIRGIFTYYCKDSANGKESFRMAGLLQDRLEKKLNAFNRVPGHGVFDDSNLGKRYGHLFLLGSKTPRVARTLQMPAVLGEALFLSNEVDVRMLRQPAVIKAEAEAYAEAVDTYFAKR